MILIIGYSAMIQPAMFLVLIWMCLIRSCTQYALSECLRKVDVNQFIHNRLQVQWITWILWNYVVGFSRFSLGYEDRGKAWDWKIGEKYFLILSWGGQLFCGPRSIKENHWCPSKVTGDSLWFWKCGEGLYIALFGMRCVGLDGHPVILWVYIS
jgi:hypothetical protein